MSDLLTSNQKHAIKLDELLRDKKIIRVGTNEEDRIVLEFEGIHLFVLDNCKFEVVEMLIN